MPSFPVESSRLKKAAETAVRESLKIKKDAMYWKFRRRSTTNVKRSVRIPFWLFSRKKHRWILPKNR